MEGFGLPPPCVAPQVSPIPFIGKCAIRSFHSTERRATVSGKITGRSRGNFPRSTNQRPSKFEQRSRGQRSLIANCLVYQRSLLAIPGYNTASHARRKSRNIAVKGDDLVREKPMNNYRLVTRKVSRVTEATITKRARAFLPRPSR